MYALATDDDYIGGKLLKSVSSKKMLPISKALTRSSLKATRLGVGTRRHYRYNDREDRFGRQQGSAIVNSGSVTGLLGNSTIIDYSMTKGGIHSLTRALSGSLASRGIRVNAVAPGPVWTPLNPADNPKALETFGCNTRMKRPAQPEECAPAYLFLASPQMSSFITGEVLPVIGAYTDR